MNLLIDRYACTTGHRIDRVEKLLFELVQELIIRPHIRHDVTL